MRSTEGCKPTANQLLVIVKSQGQFQLNWKIKMNRRVKPDRDNGTNTFSSRKRIRFGSVLLYVHRNHKAY